VLVRYNFFFFFFFILYFLFFYFFFFFFIIINYLLKYINIFFILKDKIFDVDSNTEEVYNSFIRHIIYSTMDGFNGIIKKTTNLILIICIN